VIDTAVTILGKHTQVLHMDLDKPGLSRSPQDAVIKRTSKKLRKNRNQVETHRSCQFNLPSVYALSFKSRSPAGRVTSIRRAAVSMREQISSARGTSSSPACVSTTRSGVPAIPSPVNCTSLTTPSKDGAVPSEHGEEETTEGSTEVSKTEQPIRSSTKYRPAGSVTRFSIGSSTSSPRNFSASEMELHPSK